MILKNTFVNEFRKLSVTKRYQMLKELQNELNTQEQFVISRNENIIDITCTHCKSDTVVKFGEYSNRQRYRCKACLKTFTCLTGTSISGIKKKHLLTRFIELMIDSKSIRYIASELNLSTKTVFDWRHKVLVAFNTLFTKQFNGIVEMDDVNIRFNQKGRKTFKVAKPAKKKRGDSNEQVKILITSDRYGSLDLKRIKLGRTRTIDLETNIDFKRFNEDNIICSDSHPSFINFYNKTGLKYELIKANEKQYVKGIFHVQKVNNIANDFKIWLKANFNNVSTKHLPQYLNLYTVLSILKQSKEKFNKVVSYIMKEDNSLNHFKAIENNYQKFLSNSI